MKTLGYGFGYLHYQFMTGYEEGYRQAKEKQAELNRMEKSEHPFAAANDNTSL